LRSSCPRVVFPIIFSRLVVADMGVYLGCSDLGMSQKILNDTKVGPSLVQVRGEAVPQPVGCQLRYAAGLRPLLDPLPEGRVAERSFPVVLNHLVCGLPLPWLAIRALPLWLLADQCRPACFQVMLDSLDRALTNHDDPLLVA